MIKPPVIPSNNVDTDPSIPTVRYGGETAIHTVEYDVAGAQSPDFSTTELHEPPLIESLSAGMAKVSASPQSDPTTTLEEICALLTKRTLTNAHRHQLQKVLARLLNYEGDVVPTELALYAQSLFTSVNQLTQPGVAPSQVSKAALIAGTESFIDDATQAIRQWGKQISVKVTQLWDGYFRSVKDIEDRLNNVDQQLQRLRNGVVVSPLVIVPALNVKLLSVNDKPVLTHKHVDKIIKDEVSYLLTVTKAWRAENIAFKNRLMRYFGNGGDLPLSLLNRPHPPLLSKMSYVDDEDMQYKNFTMTKSLIGHGNVSFHESTHNATNVTEKASRLVNTHYMVILAKDTNFRNFTDEKQEPWSLATMSRLYDVALQAVEIMRSLAKDNSALDIKDKEIYEVINIVKQLPTPTLTDAFSDIIAAYQLDVSQTQQNLFRYIFDFVTALIDVLNLHLQAYRSA